MTNDLSPVGQTSLSDSEIQGIWQQTCQLLQERLTSAVFTTWVRSNPLTNLILDESTGVVTATISSPTPFHAATIQKNLNQPVSQALTEVVGGPVRVEVVVTRTTPSPTPTPTSQPPETTTEPNPQPIGALVQSPTPVTQKKPLTTNSSPRVEDLFSPQTIEAAVVDRAVVTAKTVGLRTDYQFSTFAVSTTNEMAHAAAVAVSNNPGASYNPLFLYGGVGVGKTHLMHAIGNNILRQRPETKIIYCTGEEFTNDIVHAIQSKKALLFKERYRTAEVFLIDDVQFLAGKNAVQEEFFHTFNALIKKFSQVVLTSDRPPHEINLLEARLRSRFEAGLMIDIQQPSFELRTAIFLIKAEAAGISIPMELAQLIASKVDSARKIEGLIKSLRSEVELKNQSISQELIEKLLQADQPQTKTRLRVTAADVIKVVANHYHVKQIALKGQRRTQDLVKARHVAMYLLKEELHLPYTEIGRWFANRDHTSALHGIRKIQMALTTNESLQREISALRMSLSAISR